MSIIWAGMRDKDKHWQDNASVGDCFAVNYTAKAITCGVPNELYTCYDGYMETGINVSDITYYKNIQIGNEDTIPKILRYMEKKYPMGTTFHCWYNINDPSDIHLGDFKESVYIWLSFAVIIIIILVHGYIYIRA